MNPRFASAHSLRLLLFALLLAPTVSCGPGTQNAEKTKQVDGGSPKTEAVEAKQAEDDKTADKVAEKGAEKGADKGAEKGADKGAEKGATEPEAKKKPHGKAHKPNRLVKETSPYLLLHAHNPVDWYPWGPEALEKAKKEGKIIFLSIGYSSCHWCHVMERESFLDDEIAAVMNANFVCIKVDREERPDIDNIYMTSLQVYNQLSGSGGGGGWPLSMFLTPDGEPFFGGTYFPARDGDRGPTMGFLTIIKRIQELWKAEPDKLREDAQTLSKVVKQQLGGRQPLSLEAPSEKTLVALDKDLQEQFDPEYGGFGFSPDNPRRPKFPEPSNLLFLIDRIQRTRAAGGDDATDLKLLTATLDGMARGGIRDHIGGGFHRYSVDRFWQIPHFEKMLYDNGQLATAYTEAYLLTKHERYRRIVVEMLDFVLSEMTDKQGGFLSALDAESEDEEGKFYRWEKEEVEKLLDEEEFKLFAEVYGLTAPPNFEREYYAPQLSLPMAELAKALKLTEEQLEAKLTPIRKKLFDVRAKRPRPLTDDKILTAWNGLMIRGFADSGKGLKEPRFTAAAARAADFVLESLRTEDGRLQRTYSRGQAKLNAYVDDYAFLVDGLIALHQATGEEKWLKAADELTAKQIELFWDSENAGFFFTSGDHETLLARSKNFYDSAKPAGNSVAAQNLLYLGDTLKKDEYIKHARDTIRGASELLARAPAAAPRMAIALATLVARDGESPPTPKTDAPKTDAPKTDAPKTDAPKTDAPKTDAPKTDAPKTDAPKTDAPKTDAPKTDAPKTDAPKTDAPKTDAPKTDAPKTDAPKTDAPKTDAPKTDAPMTDAPKTDADKEKPAAEKEQPKADAKATP